MLELTNDCKKKINTIERILRARERRKKSPSWQDNYPLDSKQINFQQAYAARTIQRFWRTTKAKEAFSRDPYHAYLSLVSIKDPQHNLSQIMFGLHVAEMNHRRDLNYNSKLKNPFINSKMHYRRTDEIGGIFKENLLKEFNVPELDREINDYIPISHLRIVPIRALLQQHFPKSSTTLIEKDNRTILLLVIPKDKDNEDILLLKKVLSATGIIATLWEIAENTKLQQYSIVKSELVSLEPRLPKTKEALLNSRFMGKLNLIANSYRHPTHRLAKCLSHLLHDLPELSQEAIQRIALILDITNTFYAHHYPNFAFCVYVIVHEISLFLSQQTDPDLLEKQYDAFVTESNTTFLQVLNLEPERLSNIGVISFPGLSGANAYVYAMALAMNMKTNLGTKPTIRVVEPNYYEFDYITQSTSADDADIYLISAGPIVDSNGINPGIDINKFIRRHVINNRNRKLVTTIIIDATTALYKNLRLDEDVRRWVEEGFVIIIIHKSHQKFGLLHTDQAQFGCIFVIHPKNAFEATLLAEMERNSRIEFYTHVDMRIGAYISVACKETLEEIKAQHFRNGALWGAASKVSAHEDMLREEDEYYFFSTPLAETSPLNNIAAKFFLSRDSFGHYSCSANIVGVQLRISPCASDEVDALIQQIRVALALKYSEEQIKNTVIQNAINFSLGTLEKQMICIAALNNIADCNPVDKLHTKLKEVFDESWKKLIISYESRIEEIKTLIEEILAKIKELERENNYEALDYWYELLELEYEHIKDLEREIVESRVRVAKDFLLPIDLIFAMSAIIKKCELLKGRQFYTKIEEYLHQLHKLVIDQIEIVDVPLFFKTLEVLYAHNIQITQELIFQAASSPLFCLFSQKVAKQNPERMIGSEHNASSKSSPSRAGIFAHKAILPANGRMVASSAHSPSG